jgi:hypothetical protein
LTALFAALAAGTGTLALALENPAEAPNPNDPTVKQVYDAASAGHLDQAHQMIQQVLANHPHSARAHYVAADIDAAMKNYGEAREELKLAEQIEPGLPRVDPRSVAALRQEIGAPAVGVPSTQARREAILPAQPAAKSFPWGTVLIVAAVVFVLWLLFRRRTVAAPYNPYPGSMPNTAAGPGPVMPPPGGFPSVTGGVGSGIVGGLASGLAVGAGIAAGEDLVRHFEHGGAGPAPERYGPVESPPPADPNADLGGPDFGISDGSGWDDGGGSGGGDDGGWT